MNPSPPFPRNLEAAIPEECLQVLLVLSPSIDSHQAEGWRLQRSSARSPWSVQGGPFAVTLGARGLGWGAGLHRSSPPDGMPVKLEGDKRSPAGVFEIPLAFGTLPAADASQRVRLPYTHLTPHTIGVDDPTSSHYNRIVDDREVLRDWVSHESMDRHRKLYEWGAFISHNPSRIPGLGSCIFLHLAPDRGRPTAGCTALDTAELLATVEWLDPACRPVLVQGLAPH